MFRDYAQRIGADYLFSEEEIAIRAMSKRYFGALRPLYDPHFQTYDAVLFVDMDVIPKADLSENIFDCLDGHIMLAEETRQPSLRMDMKGNINAANDVKWAKVVQRVWRTKVARDAQNRPRVFNSGVVLYSAEGLRALRKILPPVLAYQLSMRLAGLPRFYRLDQNYLNAFLHREGVDFKALSGHWNAQITMLSDIDGNPRLLDERSPDSRFFHMQHGPSKPHMSRAEALAVAKGDFAFPGVEKI